MTTKRLIFVALLAASCGAPQATDDGDSDSMATTSDDTLETAAVGQQARVTATDGLNLRSGPGTSYDILLLMPYDAEVPVLAVSNGWYQVTYSGKTGWCSGMYLSVGTSTGSAGGTTAVDEAIARAESGVGFSYHWGAGCWSPGSTAHGACYGSCPSCTHSGTWGADCSGYVAKVWQVPGASAVSTCSHPYSTANFYSDSTHWSTVSRGSLKRGDALVYHSNGAGHIFIYESGDGWGWMQTYEAKGCSYGIQHDTRNASSSYKGIRRDGY
jgi:cell wall-associated NlpC family hydrolase